MTTPTTSLHCPNPQCPSNQEQEQQIIRHGTFVRVSDGQKIQRFLCKCCGKRFSQATGTEEFAQKKRGLNLQIFLLLSSAMSMRRMANYLQTTRKTLARKLKFVSSVCVKMNQRLLEKQNLAETIQFDEIETFEHSKCKPLAIALAVQEENRLILGCEVSSMPAKGKLASIARKKYQLRKNERRKGLKTLLNKVKPYVSPRVILKSDQKPFYASVVRQCQAKDPGLEQWKYEQYQGEKGCVVGEEDMKKRKHDPLFSVNHTMAMLRANINRLFRKSWNTTKKVECLEYHLNIYTYYHNRVLLNKLAYNRGGNLKSL